MSDRPTECFDRRKIPGMITLLLIAVMFVQPTALHARNGYDPPIPTKEEREALRKSNQLWHPAEKASLMAEQVALLAAQDDVDITHYFLDLDFLPISGSGQGTVEGSVTVSGTSLVNEFQHLVLNFASNMAVSSITQGTTSLSFTHAGDILDITLDRPFNAGESFDVTIAYSEDLSKAQVSFSNTVSMIEFFAQTFGEYPFVEDKYGMSEFPVSGAMEHTTNTSYGRVFITGDHAYDWADAHELSHQWWGDSVSPLSWRDIWLNEGFATHCEALWFEHVNGPQGYQDYMNSFWRAHFNGPVYDNPDWFGTTVYDKGGWVQHVLRGVMGDTAFFNGLRDWYANNKDGIGDTAGYQQTISRC